MLAVAIVLAQGPASPQAVADELLATDRTFAAARFTFGYVAE